MFSAKIKADPFATAAYDQLAVCLTQRGDHQGVLRRMKTALRDNPGFTRGWLHLGRAAKALGRTPLARRALARACKGGISEACRP